MSNFFGVDNLPQYGFSHLYDNLITTTDNTKVIQYGQPDWTYRPREYTNPPWKIQPLVPYETPWFPAPVYQPPLVIPASQPVDYGEENYQRFRRMIEEASERLRGARTPLDLSGIEPLLAALLKEALVVGDASAWAPLADRFRELGMDIDQRAWDELQKDEDLGHARKLLPTLARMITPKEVKASA